MKQIKDLSKLAIVAGMALSASIVFNAPANAQSVGPFTGQIKYFGFPFCPSGMVAANGTLLSIHAHSELFSLLGTAFGGDGRRTFGVPDLRGRFAVGLSQTGQFGQRFGVGQMALTTAQLPEHTHVFYGSRDRAGSPTPVDYGLASFAGVPAYAPGEPLSGVSVTMHANSISQTGSGQLISIQDPYLSVTACIFTDADYPTRGASNAQ